LAGAPPPQPPGRLGLRDLRAIQARRTGTGIETATETETETKTTTKMQDVQARLPHARRDSILRRTTMEERFASENNDLAWSGSALG
jgi:hypothetical protein